MEPSVQELSLIRGTDSNTKCKIGGKFRTHFAFNTPLAREVWDLYLLHVTTQNTKLRASIVPDLLKHGVFTVAQYKSSRDNPV
jgi:hypothetical protein